MHDRERANRGRGEGLRKNPDRAQPVDRFAGGLRGIAKADKDPEEGNGRERRGGPQRRREVEPWFDDPLRQNAAHDRPQHDADRERQREQAHVEGALIFGREIGYGGLGDRLAAGHEARQEASEQQQGHAAQLDSSGHHGGGETQAAHADQQHRLAAEAVGKIAQHRGAEEHARRIEHVAKAEQEVRLGRRHARAQQRSVRTAEHHGEDRIDEAEAQRIDGDGQQAGRDGLEILEKRSHWFAGNPLT